ncbi:MAG: restriction endonuclease subunit S [Planctomycetaceae bacterium]
MSENDHRLFTKRCKAEHGDVLYSKDGATRGRPCFVDTNREFSYFVSVALIKPLRDELDGHYLVHLLNSNWIKDRMVAKSRGDMIPHIVLGEIRAFPVPVPSLAEQRRIVAELDALQAEVDAMQRLQSETAAELDALLPAILDRAFKGEL